jgi:filamentous hemagglutinin family protein
MASSFRSSRSIIEQQKVGVMLKCVGITSPPEDCPAISDNWILVLLPLTLAVSCPNPAIAQIIPDNTLGTESSVLTPIDALNNRIDGGAIRGSNLFHSFQDFNIDNGQSAFFNNPTGIENILTRVTGGNPSNIFGTLGVLGNANLFLVNPNGIVFGPNARLDIGGSFFASTAESLVFNNGYQFSATNPDAPPLLTVNIPIGLQFGANPGAIVNQSVATNDAGEVRGLQVPSGETLALVGGNVTLDRGNVQPRGAQVELGGLAVAGTVGVNADGSLSFPAGVEWADVVLRNAAEVNVRAGGGGSIAVRARNLEMSGGSIFRAGIESGMGAPGAQGGDIVVEATGTTALSGGSFVTNQVQENATGNGGNVDVSTGSLQVSSGASLGANTRGQGNGGLVRIQATDTVSFDGVSSDGLASGAFSAVIDTAVGNTQGIEITTGTLSVSNGAQINTSVYGQGNSGRISIVADTVIFDRGDALSQVLTTEVENSAAIQGIGNSGGIEIVTGSLFLNNAASLGTSTFGRGNAGRITIHATDTVSLNGISPAEHNRSSIVNTVAPGAVGDSQGIDITTASLRLNNAFLGTTTLGQGDAGKIAIQAANIVSENTFISSTVGPEAVGNSQGIDIATGSLSLFNSQLDTLTNGQGDAGHISILATDFVSLDNSSISSFANQFGNPLALGSGGDISIAARTLSLNNSDFSAQTNGQGNAGDISVRVTDSVSMTGGLGFTTAVLALGIGKGGDIYVETGNLFLGTGTSFRTSTNGRGDAGEVMIRAKDTVTLDGSSISTHTNSRVFGNAGRIDIYADRLSLANGASIGADNISTDEEANPTAANIEVDANRIDLDRSDIATSTSGGAGNITLRSPELVLRNNSIIRTDAFEEELTGGNITIKSDVIAALENSDINANALQGQGGNVTITAAGIFGTQFREGVEATPESDITATGANRGQDGIVQIDAEINPASGLVSLPESLVDAASLLGKDFCSRQRNSQFIVTGRGGIPATPADPASPSTVWQDWSLTEIAETPTNGATSEAASPERVVLIEAQGWYTNEAGQVILTANPTTATPHSSGRVPVQCGSQGLYSNRQSLP